MTPQFVGSSAEFFGAAYLLQGLSCLGIKTLCGKQTIRRLEFKLS
jgi:hypothetical protein